MKVLKAAWIKEAIDAQPFSRIKEKCEMSRDIVMPDLFVLYNKKIVIFVKATIKIFISLD